MALIQSYLEAQLYVNYLSPPFPSTTIVGFERLASAYNNYAVSAMAGAYPMLPTGLEVTKFLSSMASAQSNQALSGAVFANTLANAVSAYWLGALFTPAVVAIPLPGLAVLATALQAFYATHRTREAAAKELAGYLDAATRTVLAADSSSGATFLLA